MSTRYYPFNILEGKTLTECYTNEAKDELHFVTTDGHHFIQLHFQDCCESVSLDDINGDLQDLVGSPILQAEEQSKDEDPPSRGYEPESFTWSFYKLATAKGFVELRWYGESNGYYSETVDLVEYEDEEVLWKHNQPK